MPGTMPKGERALLAHLSVEALPQISRKLPEHMRDSVLDLADQIGCELGMRWTRSGTRGWTEEDFQNAMGERIGQLRAALPRRRSTGLDTRLQWLGQTVDLDQLDVDILRHLVRARMFEPYSQLLQLFVNGPRVNNEVHVDVLAALLGKSALTIHKRMEPGSALLSAGLVTDCRGGDWTASGLSLRIAQMPTVQPAKLAKGLLGSAPAPTLGWENFNQLGELGELARTLVHESSRRRTGLNILLYGVPGTGKSEFARVLAQACGLHAVMVGATDEYGTEPERSERLGHLAICRSLVRRSSEHLLIVDEAEDLMIQPSFLASKHSKLYLNNLVERSTSPTIWIVNDHALLGSAVLRRMTLAIHFQMPNRALRRKLVDEMVDQQRLSIPSPERDSLAAIKVAPAVMRNAVQAAAWTDGRASTAIAAASSIERALGAEAGISRSSEVSFHPALCGADMDLELLVSRLAAAAAPNWSLLASGPPGTGKSALARYIAGRLGIEVVEKRASDLLNMYVGNTEKAIAAAFRQAADQKAMLIIDEADSLLRDRQLASRSWEVSMTNEMLTWMERAATPFVATTNLRDSLDPATSRRFVFKISFRPLSRAQARALFEHYFGQAAPAALDHIHNLTPGDFALVARKAQLLGEEQATTLAEMLEAECAAKPDASRAPMGFLPQPSLVRSAANAA
ncbi:AAA family ATPase [Sphingomonas sp. LHG3406-1]|uniref:AAA family ATPase n=1 Tax=Sphingomonas sp. LHG3406-1 TaxID=2804617 RepID=UPI00261671D7|nr:AAA family ATPase [Sphingomonas sp. LHG3406-1]